MPLSFKILSFFNIFYLKVFTFGTDKLFPNYNTLNKKYIVDFS